MHPLRFTTECKKPQKMNKKIVILEILIIVILFTGCIRNHEPPTTIPIECGNGICEAGEDKNNCPTDCKETNLSDVKVAIQYRIVTDGEKFNRAPKEVINIFKETNADFIFQGWLTQWPLPNKISDLPIDDQRRYEVEGYSYEHLERAVSEIKSEFPDIIFSGGTQLEFFYPDELQDIDEENRRDAAWNMALNPEKWGINYSKKDMQCYWAKRWGFIEKEDICPNEEKLKSVMTFYFPDITNPDFQEIFLNRIYRQIDAGVDAVWIDMFYVQQLLLQTITHDENHPAVKESYESAWDIVDKIHEYGLKKGKKIYVITWVADSRGTFIVSKTNIDIGMVTPSTQEVKDESTGKIGQFDEVKWDKIVSQVNSELRIPMFARLDYGGLGRTPLSVFSQELSNEEANVFLKDADDFFSEKGVTFIYPIHGGDMGPRDELKKLSHGKYNWYDSLAPEFRTYETIKELALNKTKK